MQPQIQPQIQQQQQQQPQPGSQLEMVLAEARRLEEVAHRNEDELRLLAMEQNRGQSGGGGNGLHGGQDQLDVEDPNIRAEIMQLKQRLAGTDQELQKTNHTLRYVLYSTLFKIALNDKLEMVFNVSNQKNVTTFNIQLFKMYTF